VIAQRPNPSIPRQDDNIVIRQSSGCRLHQAILSCYAELYLVAAAIV